MDPFDLDPDLINKVKQFEGYEAVPKWDYKQHSSGWGTPARPGERPSREEHEQRLRNELGKAAEFVDANVPNLPEGVRNAMISLTFNAGGSWANSGLGSQLRAGDYEGAKQSFLRYNKAGGQTLSGLVDRRAAEAAMFQPGTYDTEDRTAAGIGLTRNQDEAMTFDPTGRKRMANGDQQGILGALGMQNQQPQGLLGALGDPETMAYIGMMLKGLSPYSNIDPNSMLSSAHTNALRKEALRQQMAERATDNQRADRALNLREQEYGLSRQDRDDRARALSEERQQKRDMAEAQRKADAAAFGDLTGRPTDTTAAPDAAAPFAPLSNDDKIAKIDQRLAQGGLSDAGEKQLLRLREQYSKPPSASVLKQITKDEDAIPVYDDIGRKLDRALELAPKVSTGLKATAETTFGPMLGDLAPQQTKDTINFRNITSQFAIENMSQTMKGATSDKEMFKNLSIAADERNDIGIRIEALKRAKERNDQLKEIVTNRKKQLEEGTYGRKQPAKSEQPSGGKTRLRFNPETGDFE